MLQLSINERVLTPGQSAADRERLESLTQWLIEGADDPQAEPAPSEETNAAPIA